MNPTSSPQPPGSAAMATARPWKLHVRKMDGSCFISEGDYVNGRGQAFDVCCDEATAKKIVARVNAHDELVEALELWMSGMRAVPTMSGESRITGTSYLQLVKAYHVTAALFARHLPPRPAAVDGVEEEGKAP